MINSVCRRLSAQTPVGRFTQNTWLYSLAFLLALAFASSSFAYQIEVAGVSDLPFSQEVFTSNLRVSVSAAKHSVDLSSLLAGIGESDTMESVEKKVDRLRTKKYPNEEIRLEVENIGLQTEYCGYIDLWFKRLWYNTGDYWSVKTYDGASCAFSKVKQGRYDHYIWDGGWKYVSTTKAGGLWTSVSYGNPANDGYRGIGNAAARADVIMYFFR